MNDNGTVNIEIAPFDQLKFALAAYNDANRQMNRMWSTSALIAVVVFASNFSDETPSILGIDIDSEFVLPVTLIILSGANVSYAVSHVSAYRIAAVYQSIIRKSFTHEAVISSEFSWYDLAQRAPVSSFNRIYPLFLPLERRLGKWPYRILKSTYDILFCGLPMFAIIFGLYSLPTEAPLYALSLCIGSFSIIASIFLMRWVVRWPGIAAD